MTGKLFTGTLIDNQTENDHYSFELRHEKPSFLGADEVIHKLVCTITGVGYSFAIPIFIKNDEDKHRGQLQHLMFIDTCTSISTAFEISPFFVLFSL